MLNFALITILGILGLIYAWPRIKAYQAAIGVPEAVERAGGSILARIRVRLRGVKTIILGYVALLISALPGLAASIPEIHHAFEQIDLSIWLSPSNVILVNNLINFAMLFTRLAGMAVVVNGVPTKQQEGE